MIMTRRFVVYAGLILLAVGFGSYLLFQILSLDLLSVATEIASPWFVEVYVGMLLFITIAAIGQSETRLSREWVDARRLADLLHGAEKPDAQLRILNRLTDARITGSEFCRTESLTAEERAAARRTSVLRATGAFLGLAVVTPPSGHYIEGLRPAEEVLRVAIRKHIPRLADLADILVRLGLLGTFAGLIAALAIASANVAVVQETVQGSK